MTPEQRIKEFNIFFLRILVLLGFAEVDTEDLTMENESSPEKPWLFYGDLMCILIYGNIIEFEQNHFCNATLGPAFPL